MTSPSPGAPSSRRWWRRLSLRVRLIVLGVSGVGLALLLAGFAFYGALTFAVDRTLDTGALAAADEVAALVRAGELPSPVPVSGAQVVQVVDAEHRVVAGSATADRLTPLLSPDELGRALAGEAVQVPRLAGGSGRPTPGPSGAGGGGGRDGRRPGGSAGR